MNEINQINQMNHNRSRRLNHGFFATTLPFSHT
jgi:hypothetical protein